MSTIYGLEATIASDVHDLTDATVIDTLHDLFTDDDNVYSADMITEGARLHLLLGVEMPSADQEAADKQIRETLAGAFKGVGWSTESVTLEVVEQARALATAR